MTRIKEIMRVVLLAIGIGVIALTIGYVHSQFYKPVQELKGFEKFKAKVGLLKVEPKSFEDQHEFMSTEASPFTITPVEVEAPISMFQKTKDFVIEKFGSVERGWDKTKRFSSNTWDNTKTFCGNAWTFTKELPGKTWDKIKSVYPEHKDKIESPKGIKVVPKGSMPV